MIRTCFVVLIVVCMVDAAVDIRSVLCTKCPDEGKGDDCKTYLSPIETCYNPMELFGNDSQWGFVDIYDACMFNGSTATINRTFYQSTNSTCSGKPDGGFSLLPTSECIGPFGKPRPWGILTCSQQPA